MKPEAHPACQTFKIYNITLDLRKTSQMPNLSNMLKEGKKEK